MTTRARLTTLALATALVIAPACASDSEDEPEPLRVIACSSAEMGSTMDVASDVHVFVDPDLAPIVQADLGAYLSRLWKRPVSVAAGTPDTPRAAGDAIWISSSAAARARANAPDGGYALVRADDGARKIIVAAAASPNDLVAASYALLEELGIRFFHPMQELVPELDAPRFPRGLDARRTPMTKVRGLQIHTLHPLEYLRTLFEPGEATFAEARRLVDWLVKTGQNHLQWVLLGSVDWAPFAAHARRIADYAHSRGVTVGASLNLSERLTGAYDNPTFYPFGYLRQVHTQCLWRRRDEFARLIIEEDVLDSTSDVPRCLE